MTLFDIRNQLISVLLDQSVITREDFAGITLDEKDKLEDSREAIVRAACDELVSFGLLKSIGEDKWMLAAPLSVVRNELSLSLPVAHGVADIINTFLDANELEGERVDPLAIHEGHIVALLDILGNILDTDPGGASK